MRKAHGSLAMLVCASLLSGCISGGAALGVAGALAAAAPTVIDVVEAAGEVRSAIEARKDLRGKLHEFRLQYCARKELRLETRETLFDLLVGAGVGEDEAFAEVSVAKRIGARLCRPRDRPASDGGG